MALTGNLEDLSFAEIVQAVNQGRKSGELKVRRGQEEAKILFSQGEVAQAELEAPGLHEAIIGAEVIYRLLGWKAGDFEFNRRETRVHRAITQTTDELILEGMKRLDEWERVEEEMTNLNVILRLRAGKVGDTFDLLSTEARNILPLIDAHRTVSDIIRESGLDPARALLTITELISEEVVEKWEPPAATRLTVGSAAGINEAPVHAGKSINGYFRKR